jgi:CHASE2 domain-containing sensor protein
VEPTVFGQQLVQMGASLLQVRLSDSSGLRGNPVRIVDISSLLPSSPASATGAMVVTNRLELRKYLDQVASAGPSAIGIDVIFDPAPDGTVSDEDYKFLDHCLHLSDPSGRRIPVLVGIYSTVALGKERWLGYPRFGPLGASIQIPFEAHKSAPTGSMYRQFSFTKKNKQTVTVDSLSYGLVKIAQKEASASASHREIGIWLQSHWPWLFTEPQLDGKIKAELFPIDFGLVRKMMDHPILAEDIKSHLPDLVNKVVLIGRAQPGEAPDTFTTTASDEPIPGVYIHAAAVYTLMEAPLWELSEWVRYSIDLLLALVMLLFERLLEHLLGSVSHDKLRRSLEVLMPALLAVAVLKIGVLCVDHTGIYWTDFVLVAFVLLIHKPLEAGCHIVWEVVQKSPRLLWRKT